MAVEKGVGIAGRGFLITVLEVLETELGGVKPVLVGLGRHQTGLQLPVIDNTAFLEVDEEHFARLQAPFLDNFFFRNRQYSHFGGQHHQIVIGNVIARGPQAVTVEGGADLPSVGKGDGGGAVPGLHDPRIIFVKCPPFFVHQGVAGPCFGYQKHHGVGQGIAARHEKFQGVVDTGGIGLTLGDERPDLVEIVSKKLRGHGAAACIHPVEVTAQGVDLAVVTENPERLGQAPSGEGVGGKALMHQGQSRNHAFVGKVLVKTPHLMGQHHALEQQGSRREGENIEVFHAFHPAHQFSRGVFHLLANNEKPALEPILVGTGLATPHKKLTDNRFGGPDALSDVAVIHRYVAPAQHLLPLGSGELFQQGLAFFPRRRVVGRQEQHGHAVFALRRQINARIGAFGAQEGVGHLDQDPRPVTGLGIGSHGAAMGEILEDGQALTDDFVAFHVFDIGHETDAAGIMLVPRIVEPLTGRQDRMYVLAQNPNAVPYRFMPLRPSLKRAQPHLTRKSPTFLHIWVFQGIEPRMGRTN